MQAKAQIEVRKNWGRNELYINGFTQSTSSYQRDWYKVLKRAGVLGRSNQHVLLLGLGGGDLVKLLTKHQPGVAIVAVELESEVVAVARDYFGVAGSDTLNVVVGDAQTYMQTNHDTYDLVIVDLYNGDDVPDFVGTPNFLANVATALTPSGHAIFNYASHSFRTHDFVSFEKQLQIIFSSVQPMRIWGHTFYMASDRRILAMS